MSDKQVVVSGYATLDYVIELAEPFHGTGTKTIRHRPHDDWPRAGGAALFASRALARAGHRVSPVTWVGPGLGGAHYRSQCQEYGIDQDGVALVPSGRTPTCVLTYQPGGDYGCLFDPGFSGDERLTDPQHRLIRRADLVCLAVGPPHLGGEILSLVRPDAVLAWIAKTDLTSYTPELRAAYAKRANYIFCNTAERAFVDDSFQHSRRPHQVVFETQGRDGVVVDTGGDATLVPARDVEAPDTTGAGDTLAGAALAALLAAPDALEDAARAGVAAARDLLLERG